MPILISFDNDNFDLATQIFQLLYLISSLKSINQYNFIYCLKSFRKYNFIYCIGSLIHFNFVS